MLNLRNIFKRDNRIKTLNDLDKLINEWFRKAAERKAAKRQNAIDAICANLGCCTEHLNPSVCEHQIDHVWVW